MAEVFHDALCERLAQNVRDGKNANTYIFEGADGLCKHNAAMLFARMLVCENVSRTPCGECAACREALAGTHPDIIHITREKDRATLGIKPVRDMITESMITPFYDRHKVFIIDDGDALTPEAQNAFLKVIEEPPSYAVFIIVCTDSRTLLETVRSRSVVITFAPVSDDIVKRYIEKIAPDDPRIDFLVKYCSGIPKLADKILNDPEFETLREESLSLVPKFLSPKKICAFDISDYYDAHKDNAALITDMVRLYLRDALVTQCGKRDKVVNTDKLDRIEKIAAAYSEETIAAAMDEIAITGRMLDVYVKPSAAAMHAALKIQEHTI